MYIHPINRLSVQSFRAQDSMQRNKKTEFDEDEEFDEKLRALEEYDRSQDAIFEKGKREMFNVAAYTVAAIMPICFFTYASKADSVIDRQNQIIEEKYKENAELRKQLSEKEFECDSLKFILENKKASHE